MIASGIAMLCALLAGFPCQPVEGLRADLYEVWLREGDKRRQAGKWQPAADCYRRALEYAPEGVEGLFGLSYCLARLGKVAEAEGHLRRLLKLRPSHRDAALLMARLLRAHAPPDQALSILGPAIRAKPDDPELNTEVGSALLASGEPAKALAFLQRALEAGNNGYRTNLLLGRCYMALSKPLEAEKYLKQALRFNPAAIEPLIYLLDTFLAAGRWLEVETLARSAAKRHGDDWRIWWRLGEAGLKLAEPETAAEGLARAVALAPAEERRTLALRAAKAALAADVPEAALAALQQSPARDAETLAYTARAHEALRHARDAAKAWQAAGQLRPDLLAHAARCWLAAGERERALKCLIAVGQTDARALRQAIELALELNKADEAERHLRRLLASHPDDSSARLLLARLALRQGDVARAALLAREECGAAPAEAWHTLGAVYAAAGLESAGVAAYLRAWHAGHDIRDLEAAAELARQSQRWHLLAKIIAEADALSDALRVEIGWLALREGRPQAALAAVRRVAGDSADRVRALAEGAARPVGRAAGAPAIAGPHAAELADIAGCLAAKDPAVREKAAASLARLLSSSQDHARLLRALDDVLRDRFGSARVEKWADLARTKEAPLAVVAMAGEQLAASAGPEAAMALVQGKLKGASTARLRLGLLGLGARLALESGRIAMGIDMLSDAAALRQQPVIVSRLAVLKHLDRLRPDAKAALLRLARAWECGEGEGAAMLAFLTAVASEAETAAWLAGYRSEAEDTNLLQARFALARGEAEVAVTKARQAKPCPSALGCEVAALLKLGRAAEAEAPLTKLLRAAPGPMAFFLAGEVAAAREDWASALWWYARAVASGHPVDDIRPAIGQAVRKTGVGKTALGMLIDSVAPYAGMDVNRARAALEEALAPAAGD